MVEATPGPLRWYALYVKSRQERTVEKGLRKLGIEAWVPVREQVRNWSDRRKLVEVPYFSSYVFVRCDEERRRASWGVRGAVRYLGADGQATPLDPAEIEAIREALTRLVPFDPHPELAVGQAVLVKTGPLKGITGILVGKRKNYRLVLQVRAMGRGISTEVDAVDVEPA